MTVSTTHLDGVAFPSPDLVSHPRVRDAWEGLLKQHGITEQAQRRIDQAARDKENGRADLVARFREQIDGADDVDAAFAAADAAPEVQDAERVLAQAVELRAAAGQAEGAAKARLVAVVEANAEQWSRDLDVRIQNHADRLMNVLRALEQATDALGVDLGFREMLEPGAIAAQAGRLNLNGSGAVTAWFDSALDPLRRGVGELTLRVEELKQHREPEPVAVPAPAPVPAVRFDED